MENTMTVKELIEELQCYSENLQVMVRGIGEIYTANKVDMDEEGELVIIG